MCASWWRATRTASHVVRFATTSSLSSPATSAAPVPPFHFPNSVVCFEKNHYFSFRLQARMPMLMSCCTARFVPFRHCCAIICVSTVSHSMATPVLSISMATATISNATASTSEECSFVIHDSFNHADFLCRCGFEFETVDLGCGLFGVLCLSARV